jgi:hypothetical protein
MYGAIKNLLELNLIEEIPSWNGNTFFDKNYKVL